MRRTERKEYWSTIDRYGQRLTRIDAAADMATDPRTQNNLHQGAMDMANHDQSFVFNAIYRLLEEAFPKKVR